MYNGGIYNFWRCFKVLPLVYDESLSYYEVLCKLTQTIDDVIKQLDQDYTDIYKYIDQQDNIVLQNANAYTNSQISLVEQHLSQSVLTLTKLIQSTDANTRAWVTGLINDLTDWLEKQGTTIYVKNPITGYTDSIQNVLNDFYNTFNYFALTCLEYDMLDLTCGEYDEIGLTCEQYDFWGKKYLWKDEKLYMFNPVTGQKTFYKNVIDLLVQMHRTDGITCQFYDDTGLTCEEYDNLNITCYQYDWEAKNYIK